MGWKCPAVWFCLLAASLTAGCGSDVGFREYLEGRDVANLQLDGRQHIANVMYAMFGTPDDPDPFEGQEGVGSPLVEAGFDLARLRRAAGATWSGDREYQGGLYRRHCAHCHGITGDGAGPTAPFLNPFPRDYRLGKFKFTSTSQGIKPTEEDLAHTIREGIPGTAMPSFKVLLQEDEIAALIEYVKYLSVRGEVENTLLRYLEDGEELPQAWDELMEFAGLSYILGTWEQADSMVVTPQPPPVPIYTSQPTHPDALASVEAGRRMFQDPRAQCSKCHGPTGLGDGPQTKTIEFKDDWNKDKAADYDRVEKGELSLGDVKRKWALPVQPLSPRNLRLGIYRGGNRPVDIYRRVYAGIKGTPMPAAGPAPGAQKGALSNEEIWNLVNYVLALPYEPASLGGRDVTVLKERN